jgi:3-phytase/alkaline phosphatase D
MKQPRSRLNLFMIFTLFLLIFSLTVVIAYAKPDKGAEKDIGELEYLGLVTFETGTDFQGTEVGGLSGITYDASRGVYYVVSDDRSQINDARYYTVAIDLSDGSLDDGDVEFLSYTTLLNEYGEPYAANTIDAEGIAMRASGQIFISSEWRTGIEPFVKRFDWAGEQTAMLPIPYKFMPADDAGMHANFAFESLAITPDNQVLWTASEAALKQDGDPSSPDSDSPARMLMFDAPKRRPVAEHVYVVDAIPNPPTELPPPCCAPDNGLVELVTVDNAGTLLAMERSWWHRYGNTVELFEVKTAGATDVSGCFSLDDAACDGYTPVSKRSVLELTPSTTPTPDNLEGATFGPMLPDGRYTLILVSDNNFNPGQTTQFIAYAVEVE